MTGTHGTEKAGALRNTREQCTVKGLNQRFRAIWETPEQSVEFHHVWQLTF